MNTASDGRQRTTELPLAPHRPKRQAVQRRGVEPAPMLAMARSAIQMTTAGEEEPAAQREESIDVVKIAEKVYRMMRQDLILEAERFPWRR